MSSESELVIRKWDVFENFQLSMIDVGDVIIRVRHGGSGPPLLLLHGHPQTHVCWHRVAPQLAQYFTVVAADLRGYGDSSKPPSTADHASYSKRVMAQDQVAVMQHLGFDRFYVAGHDRGGRCAYRMALDYPEKVLKLAVLDILPTAEHLLRADRSFSLNWWHWFFLAQPPDFPERLISTNPDYFYLNRHGKPKEYYSAEALDDYRRCWQNPETIRAFCEDYRAGATIDYQLDMQDRGQRHIDCPVLVLWGQRGDLENLYGDILAIWRNWAKDVTGRGLACGHHLPEEAPNETSEVLLKFFIEGVKS